MNIANYLYHFREKLSRKFQYFYFKCFKLPIYNLSYNTGSNKFVCKGTLRNCKIHVSGKDHTILIEKGVIMNDTLIEVSGSGNSLKIGKGVKFGHGGHIRIGDNNNLVDLHDGSNFVNVFFSIADNNNKIVVGKDCLFSNQVIIRASDGHSILDENEKRCNFGKPVTIGDRVWIGYGATVLKGTVIGNDCIVGTESLLSGQEYPDNSVIAGMPAKVVKKGYHWCYKRIE